MIDPREHLLPIQQQALLALARIRSERDHLLFSMALGTGLPAKALSSLDVRDVSKDGVNVASELAAGRYDRRTVTANDNGQIKLPRHLQVSIGQHLRAMKQICRHFDGAPMRMAIDGSGMRRCETCGHEADFLDLPLFLSRFRERLSTRRMRSLFEEYRQAVWLPAHLHFDSLKETFDAAVVRGLSAA